MRVVGFFFFFLRETKIEFSKMKWRILNVAEKRSEMKMAKKKNKEEEEKHVEKK